MCHPNTIGKWNTSCGICMLDWYCRAANLFAESEQTGENVHQISIGVRSTIQASIPCKKPNHFRPLPPRVQHVVKSVGSYLGRTCPCAFAVTDHQTCITHCTSLYKCPYSQCSTYGLETENIGRWSDRSSINCW